MRIPAVVIAGGANWGAKKATKLPKMTINRLLSHEIAVSIQTDPGTSTRDHFLGILGKKIESKTISKTGFQAFIDVEEKDIAELEEKKKNGKKGKTSVSNNSRGTAPTQSVSKYTASLLSLPLRIVNLRMMRMCLKTGDFRIEITSKNPTDGSKRKVAIAHDFSGAWGIMKKGKGLLCKGKAPEYLGKDKEEKAEGTITKPSSTTTTSSSSSTAPTTRPKKRRKKK